MSMCGMSRTKLLLSLPRNAGSTPTCSETHRSTWRPWSHRDESANGKDRPGIRAVDFRLGTKDEGKDLMPDEVEEVGEESFPCSDPPSWWSGRMLRDPSPSEAKGKEEEAES